MRKFIHLENIKHFENLLKTTTDKSQRHRLHQLLQEEKASLLDDEATAADPASGTD